MIHTAAFVRNDTVFLLLFRSNCSTLFATSTNSMPEHYVQMRSEHSRLIDIQLKELR